MMRHLLVLMACVSLMCAQAQVRIGHRAGMSFSRWVISNKPDVFSTFFKDQRTVSGISFEIPVEIDVLGNGRVATGLGFVQKGLGRQNSDEYYRCNYLQLPLSLGYSLRAGHFAITPTFGAVAGINVRGHSQWLGNYTDPIGRWTDKGTTIRMPDTDIALLGRTQFSYAWGHSRLALDVSYQHGLTDAMFDIDFTDVNGSPLPSPRASQRTFALQLGYSLALSRSPRIAMPKNANVDSLLHANDSEPIRGIWIGQRFGANWSSFAFSSTLPDETSRVNDGATPLLGVSTALVVRLPIGEHFALQPELAFSQKGWNCKWFSRPTSENDLLRMNYLEMPVLAYRNFGHGRWRPYALLGPSIGMGVGGRHHYGGFGTYPFLYANSYTDDVRFSDIPADRLFAKWDVSAQLGGGVQMGDEGHLFFLEVRYQYGFTDFCPAYAPWMSSDTQAYHRNWMVNVGYLLRWRR